MHRLLLVDDPMQLPDTTRSHIIAAVLAAPPPPPPLPAAASEDGHHIYGRRDRAPLHKAVLQPHLTTDADDPPGEPEGDDPPNTRAGVTQTRGERCIFREGPLYEYDAAFNIDSSADGDDEEGPSYELEGPPPLDSNAANDQDLPYEPNHTANTEEPPNYEPEGPPPEPTWRLVFVEIEILPLAMTRTHWRHNVSSKVERRLRSTRSYCSR